LDIRHCLLVLLLSPYLLFSCYVTLRSLLSFPTRRSSDLVHLHLVGLLRPLPLLPNLKYCSSSSDSSSLLKPYRSSSKSSLLRRQIGRASCRERVKNEVSDVA